MQYRIITFTAIILLMITGNPLRAQQIEELEKTFQKDLRKVKQYPRNEERIASLVVSYGTVTQFDEDAIARLRATGQPDIWFSVYRILVKMDDRQAQVLALPEAALLKMNVVRKDYSEEILESKHRAEAYFYAHASKLLEDKDPVKAREAYAELMKLARLSGTYKDMDKLLRKAVLYGATKIEYELYNQTGKALNEQIVKQISVAVFAYRDSRLNKAAVTKPENSFPFRIRIYLTELKVSPERVKEMSYAEERDIYRDDVVVDTIRCHVEQYTQVKGASLSGRIDIYDVNMGSVVNTVPVTAESMFMHSYATLKGNPDAAGEETRKMLVQKEVPFPSNESIVMDAVVEFTKMAIKVLLP